MFLRTLAAILLIAAAPLSLAGDKLQVGSKRFTESYVLGEILTATANSAQPGQATHRQGLGNTAIVFEALKAGSIDVYPEYLGTISQEILRHSEPVPLQQVRQELAALGLGVDVPLGFNNSYALAMPMEKAQELGIVRLSDLARHPALRLGLSHEFLGRADGWPGLARRYGLTNQPRSLDHGIAYDALAARQIDVMDIYTTDARIGRLGLRVLDDDLGYFPRYDALLLYRLDAARRFPVAWRAVQHLEGAINEQRMIALNAAVELEGRSFAQAAEGFLKDFPAHQPAESRPKPTGAGNAPAGLQAKLLDRLLPLTGEHLFLVLVSVAAATAAGVPLGLAASLVPGLRQPVLGLAGVLQTIPSLALLAMLIPLLGAIGTRPALIALSVYALLPIVRNTCAGLAQVPSGLRQAAQALGMRRADILLLVELPLAWPLILAGVKTAAVMTVGTATIAAFIGAGGYGERIAVGLALNDNQMLLAGAIPSALLALVTQGLFELVERMLQRPGMR
ncbi:glycine betaine ABC transporter substrate-binding protein [Noviherbaspirillum sp. L7-7A]|uniref:ABC transporter permease/substrate-binding protein n=1 Tax=Noviherbaspirillum sp. L7-7A TaxID=2850560 RepID=UPI002011FE87|nr:glycine betaine ABC transporter substrate-binding protein [Noviherbaspirillum sp. L7-7A]